jgi:hypothetical protein
MITIKLLVWLIVAVGGNLAWHIIGIVRFKSKPNYILTTIFRWGGGIFFMVWCTPGLEWYDGLELKYFLPLIGYCICTFIVFFNPGMNLLKNKYADAIKVGFFYYGKTSGMFSKLFNAAPWLYPVIYIASIPALIYSVILIYQRY